MSEVCDSYNLVPYHNFTHAFNITHQLYVMLRRSKLKEKFLDDIDVLAMLIAAIGHDLDHRGVNNVYYVKIDSILSQTVNEIAVLENYHSYMLFRILFKDHNNFTDKLTPKQ